MRDCAPVRERDSSCVEGGIIFCDVPESEGSRLFVRVIYDLQSCVELFLSNAHLLEHHLPDRYGNFSVPM